MQATITLHDEDFTLEFFNKLKAFVKGKEVVISVKEEEEAVNCNFMHEDATEYLFGNPVMKNIIEERLERIANRENIIEVDIKQLL